MGRHGSKADLVLSKQGGGIFRQRFGMSITVGGEVVDTYFKWDDTSLRVSKIQLLKGDRSGKVEAKRQWQDAKLRAKSHLRGARAAAVVARR